MLDDAGILVVSLFDEKRVVLDVALGIPLRADESRDEPQERARERGGSPTVPIRRAA
jgi:hypothetical protein